MHNLLRLVGRRLIALPIMALGVSFLIFFLMSFSPIDPAYKALGEAATPEAIQKYHEDFGLDDPWPVRYVRYMGDLLHGEMGTYSAQRRQQSIVYTAPGGVQIGMHANDGDFVLCQR